MVSRILGSCIFMLLLTACGYSMRTSDAPLLSTYQIKKIYLAPVSNQSFKAGIENQLFNELNLRLRENRKIRVVNHLQEADAILKGTIRVAEKKAGGQTTVSDLVVLDQVNKNDLSRAQVLGLPIATSYTAELLCSFDLLKIDDEAKLNVFDQKQKVEVEFEGQNLRVIPLWSQSFGRSESFRANQKLGTLGSTSYLINESEFDRTLVSLTKTISLDMMDTLLSGF